MSTLTSQYRPPETSEQIALAWLRRARESQLSHYAMAEHLTRKSHIIGSLAFIIPGIVGTSAFLSIMAELIPTWAKITVGGASLVAAVLGYLQIFFRFSERAETHRTFGAGFGSVRRELESFFGSKNFDINHLNTLREKLDQLAERAPAVPKKIFAQIQKQEAQQQESITKNGVQNLGSRTLE